MHQRWKLPCIHTNAKANNKYIKDYYPDTESKFVMYWDFNKLYGEAMRKKLSVAGFRWKIRTIIFFRNLHNTVVVAVTKSRKYILEVDFSYPKRWHKMHSNLLFLPKRMETEKCQKPSRDMHEKKNCFVHIKVLKYT